MIATTLLQQANRAFAEGDFDQAIELYQQAKIEHPNQASAIDLSLAFCRSQRGTTPGGGWLNTLPNAAEPRVLLDFCSEGLFRLWQQDKKRRREQRLATSVLCDFALFSAVVLTAEAGSEADLQRTITALQQQNYANFETIVCVNADISASSAQALHHCRSDFASKRGLFLDRVARSQSNLDQLRFALGRVRGDYLLILTPGVEIDPQFFATINLHRLHADATGEPDLILVDHLESDSQKQWVSPFFYGGWDPDFLAIRGCQPASMLVSTQRLQRALQAEVASLGAFLGQATADLVPGDPAVLHVPEVLLTVPQAGRLPLCGGGARAEGRAMPPLGISIVIPNKNSAALLETCLGFAIASGAAFEHEVIVVDNGSDDPATLDLYRQLGKFGWFKVVSCAGVFNYSRMVNLGAKAATREVLMLLNNDVEIQDLAQLADCRRQVARPDVGVVGVVLSYPNGSIQHAGVMLPPTGAAVHTLRAASAPWRVSVQEFLRYPRNYQAVTGACMLVKRADYFAVDGHNEVDLPVEYNDIDFCLRIRAAGLRVLCVPAGEIVHHESLTRGKEARRDVLKMRNHALHYMRSRWTAQFEHDPFRSPNLSVDDTPIPFLRNPADPLHAFDSRSAERAQEQQVEKSSYSEDQVKALVFDADWYLETYPDVLSAGIDPYHHYMQTGWREGRMPCQDFRYHQYETLCRDYDFSETNLILDILDRLISGRLSLEHIRSLRGSQRQHHSCRTRLEDDGIAIHGFLTSEIGLGQAARTLSRSLDEARLKTSFFSYALPGRENEAEFKGKLSAVNRARISVSMLPLTEIDSINTSLFPGRHNILYGVWELSQPPPNSHYTLSRYDSLWVPSTFVQESLASLDLASTVIPHAIPAADYADFYLNNAISDPSRFTVLSFFDFDSFLSRKNPRAAILAFARAFEGRDDAQLIVKVRGQGGAQDRQLLSDAIGNNSNIRILDQTMTRHEMDLLIAQSDCFLSLHRAEGFGFGCAEAMALSKLVVATAYGGVTDFVTPETAHPVEYKLIPIREAEYHHFQPGQVWADPSIDHAAELLRRACENREESLRLASQGRALIQRDYSVAAVATRVKDWFQQQGLLAIDKEAAGR